MATSPKPKDSLELEPGDYLVSVHPCGTYAWRHQGSGVFAGHGVSLRRSAVGQAIQELNEATRKFYGINEPITKYHESRGIEDLADLFHFTQGDDTSRLALRTRPGGWDLRFFDGATAPERVRSFDREEAMLAAAMDWKGVKLAEGWTLVASRVRLYGGYFDVAWNLIATNPQ